MVKYLYSCKELVLKLKKKKKRIENLLSRFIKVVGKDLDRMWNMILINFYKTKYLYIILSTMCKILVSPVIIY